jgi:DNA-directed RNA polymerase subunit L
LKGAEAMKSTFPGYYPPSEEEIAECWENGMFVMDANVLLHVFRYPKLARDDLMSVLEAVADQLWIPHQVGLEFHRNRLDVIHQQTEAYDQVEALLDTLLTDLEKKLDVYEKRHLFIKKQDILQKMKSVCTQVKSELTTLKQKHATEIDEKEIFETVTKLFSDKVGKPFNKEQLSLLFREGEQRYKQKIPPGHDDQSDKSNRNRYGDLILWKQILDTAKEVKKPIVFVTDDAKPDWWLYRPDGLQVFSPRPELVEELLSNSGVKLVMYNVPDFLKEAKKRLKIEVKEETMATAQVVREARKEESRPIREAIEQPHAETARPMITSPYSSASYTWRSEVPYQSQYGRYPGGSRGYRTTPDFSGHPAASCEEACESGDPEYLEKMAEFVERRGGDATDLRKTISDLKKRRRGKKL